MMDTKLQSRDVESLSLAIRTLCKQKYYIIKTIEPYNIEQINVTTFPIIRIKVHLTTI